jgi:hypothetical protein
MLYIVAIGWMFVVVMVSVAEALAPQGSLLGAALTFLGWGVLPLSIVLYILGTPLRRRARRAAATAGAGPLPSRLSAPSVGRERSEPGDPVSAAQPDGGGHAAGDAVAAKREEA